MGRVGREFLFHPGGSGLILNHNMLSGFEDQIDGDSSVINYLKLAVTLKTLYFVTMLSSTKWLLS